MTRTVEDNALMLEAIAGHDPLDPGSAAVPSGHYRAALDRGAKGLRIGFVRHFHEIDMPAEPQVTAALEHVMRALQMLGADVLVDIELPSLVEFAAVNRVITAERGVGDPRRVAAHPAGRLRQAGAPPPHAGRIPRRWRLCNGQQAPRGDDRRRERRAWAKSTCCSAPAR